MATVDVCVCFLYEVYFDKNKEDSCGPGRFGDTSIHLLFKVTRVTLVANVMCLANVKRHRCKERQARCYYFKMY